MFYLRNGRTVDLNELRIGSWQMLWYKITALISAAWPRTSLSPSAQRFELCFCDLNLLKTSQQALSSVARLAWLAAVHLVVGASISHTCAQHSLHIRQISFQKASISSSNTAIPGELLHSWVFPYLSFDISQHSPHRHKEAINPSTSHHGATGSKSKSLVRLVLKRCNRIGKNWTSIGDHRCITIDG